MTIQAWERAGWLRRHDAQPDEVQHLWAVLTGDLRDAARTDLAPSVRFEHAYNASLKTCLVLLYAEGLRVGRVADVHHTIIRALPLILGTSHDVAADYLDACRERRDRLGTEAVGEADADALRETACALGREVGAWLAERHPALGLG